VDTDVKKISRIDLFVPPKGQYGVLHHFTKQLAAGLTHHGVRCRLLEAQKNEPGAFVDTILSDPPQCTLSFNGLLPDAGGHFFCDLIHIPHVAFLIDPPTCFLSLTKSAYTIISCADRYWLDFFQTSQFPHVLFVPHGVDKTLLAPPEQKRLFEVLMLSSFNDYEGIYHSWKKSYGAHFSKSLEEAAETALTDKNYSFLNALIQAIDQQSKHRDGLDPSKLDVISLLDQFETYIKAKDRLHLIQGITEARIDIFGSSGSPHKNWKSYFKNQPNVTAHDSIPFDQACAYMQESKIVLNSCPTIKYGAHERVLAGLACGALVVANDNVYQENRFGKHAGILHYRYGHFAEINAQINRYLADEPLRQKEVKKGQKILLKEHTWDSRAAQLLEELPAILENIRKH